MRGYPVHTSPPGQPGTPVDPEVDKALAEVRDALDRHDVERAAQCIERVLEQGVDHWEIYHLQGIIAARQQRWDDAEQHFQRAHQINPTHPGPLTNLGNLRTEKGQYDEAITYYEQALAFDPDYPNAHHNIAVALRRIGRLDESVRHLKRAQRLEARVPKSRRGGASGAGVPPAGWLLLLGALAMAAAVFWLR